MISWFPGYYWFSFLPLFQTISFKQICLAVHLDGLNVLYGLGFRVEKLKIKPCIQVVTKLKCDFENILATICNERFLVPSLSYFPRVGRVGVFTFFDLSFKNAFSVERQTPLRTGCRHHHGLRNWQLRKKEKSNYPK